MLLVAGAILLVSLIFTNVVDSREKIKQKEVETSRTKEIDEPLPKGSAFQLVFKTRYLLLIALLMMFLNWVNTTGEYILGRTVQNTANEIASTPEVIEQAQKSHASYSDGARILVDAARDQRLDGSKGLLGEKINVPEKFEVAIGAALGEYLEALVLVDKSGVDNALRILEETPERATLLPLVNIISPEERIDITQEANIFGVAKDLVEASKELLPVINLLLGNFVVVRDRKTARKLLKIFLTQTGSNIIPDWRIVTLKGEVFFARGPVSRNSVRSHGTFSQRREGNRIRKYVEKLEIELADLDSQLGQIKSRLERLEKDAELIDVRYEKEKAHLEKAQTAHSNQLAANEQVKRDQKWRAGSGSSG